MDNEAIKRNALSVAAWIRIFFVGVFLLFGYIALYVLLLICLLQAVMVLLTGSPHQNVRDFVVQFNRYLHQIVAFVTYDSEVRPFPFSPWPEGGSGRSMR